MRRARRRRAGRRRHQRMRTRRRTRKCCGEASARMVENSERRARVEWEKPYAERVTAPDMQVSSRAARRRRATDASWARADAADSTSEARRARPPAAARGAAAYCQMQRDHQRAAHRGVVHHQCAFTSSARAASTSRRTTLAARTENAAATRRAHTTSVRRIGRQAAHQAVGVFDQRFLRRRRRHQRAIAGRPVAAAPLPEPVMRTRRRRITATR